MRSSWSVYPQKRRKLPARANSTLALIARKKIPHIFLWHENLSRVPRRIVPCGFPRPLVICACVHVGKIRLVARETRSNRKKLCDSKTPVFCLLYAKSLGFSESAFLTYLHGPRPLVIRACVHVGKIRLARETTENPRDLVSSPDPSQLRRRGSGDIRAISWANKMAARRNVNAPIRLQNYGDVTQL